MNKKWISKHSFVPGQGPVLAHQHKNPDGTMGGWVADTAKVDGDCYVGRLATVFENARVLRCSRVKGSSRVHGNAVIVGAYVYGAAEVCEDAEVSKGAQIRDRALVDGKASVGDMAIVENDAHVTDDAVVTGAYVSGCATVGDSAYLCGNARVLGDAVIKGSARIGEDAFITGDEDYLYGKMLRYDWAAWRTESEWTLRYGCESHPVSEWQEGAGLLAHRGSNAKARAKYAKATKALARFVKSMASLNV